MRDSSRQCGCACRRLTAWRRAAGGAAVVVVAAVAALSAHRTAFAADASVSVDRVGTAAAAPSSSPPPAPSPPAGPLPVPVPAPTPPATPAPPVVPPQPSGAPAPPQADKDTTGHIYVDGNAGQPRSTAMVHLDLSAIPAGATLTSVVLHLTDDPGSNSDPEDVQADTAAVIVCPLTAEFTDGQPAAYDCSNPSKPVSGKRDAHGVWTFDVTTLLAVPGAATHGIVAIPDPSSQSVFSVAFVRKSATASASYTPAVETPSSTATPVVAAPVPGAGLSVALSSGGSSSGGGASVPAATAPSATPATDATVASAPAAAPLSVPYGDFRRLPRWTLLLLPFVVAAVAAWADPRRVVRGVAGAIAAAAEGARNG